MLTTKLSALNVLTIGLSLTLLPLSMPAASGQVLNGSWLSVNGTAAANNISFAIEAGDLVVTVDGTESLWDPAQVNKLYVTPRGGDDTVTNNTNIDMYGEGGPGDDYLVGGSGVDVLRGGGGDDSLFGRDGDDNLDGGPDTDYLSGGNGDDELLANGSRGSDLDVMFGGAGDDRLRGGIEMSGGRGDDNILHSAVLNPTRGAFLSGGAGDDELAFSGIDTVVRGGPGSDSIRSFSHVVNISADTALAQSDVDGGPDLDIINGQLLEAGLVLRNNGELFVAGGAEDDYIVVVSESSGLVIEYGNANFGLSETLNPSDVVSMSLQGHEGDDTLFNLSDIPATIIGGPGDDLTQTNTDLDLCINDSEGGRDVYILHGGRVEHTALGHVDFDPITVMGSERDEVVELFVSISGVVGAGTSQIDLGPGDDFYDGSINSTPVTVRGGSGNDIFIGGSGDDERFFGDAGDDTLDGGHGENIIYGGAGDDVIDSDGNVSFLSGGPGHDTINAGYSATSRIFGGAGDDMLFGTFGNDFIRGEGGDDFIDGGPGNDVIFGGIGNDTMIGGGGADVMRGEGGNDMLDGGAADDLLFGGPGNDDLIGGGGDDELNGDGGTDTLDGGPGTNVLNQ